MKSVSLLSLILQNAAHFAILMMLKPFSLIFQNAAHFAILMMRPLNGINVHTFFEHFPKRAHFS